MKKNRALHPCWLSFIRKDICLIKIWLTRNTKFHLFWIITSAQKSSTVSQRGSWSKAFQKLQLIILNFKWYNPNCFWMIEHHFSSLKSKLFPMKSGIEISTTFFVYNFHHKYFCTKHWIWSSFLIYVNILFIFLHFITKIGNPSFLTNLFWWLIIC
jgi:hypothetical protein